MPELPISGNECEIFATTLGIMLYPGLDEDDRARARAFTSQYLAIPVKRFVKDGGQVSSEFLLELATSSGYPLDDISKRWQKGELAGNFMMAIATLCMSHYEYASQENAVKMLEYALSKAGKPGVRSSILKAVKEFSGVIHLWGAWNIRGGFSKDTDHTNNSARIDFMRFLGESESLLTIGLEWERPGVRHGRKTMIDPKDAWHVPAVWPEYYELVGAEGVSRIPVLSFSEEQLAGLKKIPGVKPNSNVQE